MYSTPQFIICLEGQIGNLVMSSLNFYTTRLAVKEKSLYTCHSAQVICVPKSILRLES